MDPIMTRSRGLKRHISDQSEGGEGREVKHFVRDNKRPLELDHEERGSDSNKRHKGQMTLRSQRPSYEDQVAMQMDLIAEIHALCLF